MPTVGSELTVSAGERPQTYALDRAATGIGTKVDIGDKSLAVWTQLPRIKKREHQDRRTPREFRTPVANCHEVDGAIFENLM